MKSYYYGDDNFAGEVIAPFLTKLFGLPTTITIEKSDVVFVTTEQIGNSPDYYKKFLEDENPQAEYCLLMTSRFYEEHPPVYKQIMDLFPLEKRFDPYFLIFPDQDDRETIIRLKELMK